MKNNKLGSLFWILLVVCILNIVGHLAVYPALPDTVPIHWGASGEVNGWSSKQSNLIFCVLPLAMLVFMEVVRRIDPKHQNFERFGKVWNIFITLFVLFMCGMTWLTELTVFNMLPQSSNIISLLVRRRRCDVHHPGQLYAQHQAELHLRLPHALGAKR